MHMDLTASSKLISDKIYDTNFGISKNGVPLVVCNLALHYMLSDRAEAENTVDFINQMLSHGGRFICTGFDGAKVFDKLEENKGKFVIEEEGNVKFSIIKRYKDTKFVGNGLKIGVLHPFSAGTHYDENLINNKFLQTTFRKRNMSRVLYGSYSKMLARYKKENSTNYKSLTPGDIAYVSLYHFVSYFKP